MLYAQYTPCRHLQCTAVLESFHQIVRKTYFRTARANPSYFGQTSLWWQMLPLKDGELIEECLRTQGMWSLQGTRAICLLLKTVIHTVQMLTDSFINMHFFYRHCGLQAFLMSGDCLLFFYTSLNCINNLEPISQPKFRPDALLFIPTRGGKVKCILPHISLLKIEWRKRFPIDHNPTTWSDYSGTCTRWITSLFYTTQRHE